MASKSILIGSGLAGGVMAAFLGRRGYEVDPTNAGPIRTRAISLAGLAKLAAQQMEREYPVQYGAEVTSSSRGSGLGHDRTRRCLR